MPITTTGVAQSEVGGRFDLAVGYSVDGVNAVMTGYLVAAGSQWQEGTDITDEEHLVQIGSPSSSDRFGRFPVISQGDWTGGERQKYFVDPTKFYSTDGNLDTTKPGLLQIAGQIQTVALPAGFTTASPEAETWGRTNTDVLGSGASFNVARVTNGTATGVLVTGSAANVPIAMVEAQGGPFYLISDGIYTTGGKLAGSVAGQVGIGYFGGLLYYWSTANPAQLRSNNNAGTDVVVLTLSSFETTAGILGGPDGLYYWTYSNKETFVYRFDGASSTQVGRINGQVLKARTALGSVYLLALLLQAVGATPAQQQTFNYTGGTQTWTVPAGITSVTVSANGAQGGGGTPGGLGGRVAATLSAIPGDVWTIAVAGQGGFGIGQAGFAAGFGGVSGAAGGGGGNGPGGAGSGGGGGGGATTISKPALANAVVAGGGGGAGGLGGGGGVGGLITAGGPSQGAGATGASTGGGSLPGGGGGGGGTGSAGGAGGSPGFGGNGASLSAGAGGTGGAGASFGAGGGGGAGGGWFGGGGGGAGTPSGSGSAGSNGGGGGGGGSHADASATSVTITDGVQAGNGTVTLTYSATTTALNYTLYQLSGSSLNIIDDLRNAPGDFQPAVNSSLVGTHVGMDSDERLLYVYWPGNQPGGTTGYGVRAYDIRGNVFLVAPTPAQANASPGGSAVSANQNGLVIVSVTNNVTTITQRSNISLAPSGVWTTSYFDAGVPLIPKRWRAVEFQLDGPMPAGASVTVAYRGDLTLTWSAPVTATQTGNTYTVYLPVNLTFRRIQFQIIPNVGSGASPAISYGVVRYDLGRVWDVTVACSSQQKLRDGTDDTKLGIDKMAVIKNIRNLSGGDCVLFIPSPVASPTYVEQVNAKLIDYTVVQHRPAKRDNDSNLDMEGDVRLQLVEAL